MANLRIPTPRAYWDDASGTLQDFKSWVALFISWIILQNIDRETPLGDTEQNNLLLLMLGAEGMKIFRSNPAVADIAAITFADFSKAVQETFDVPVNTVRARFAFANRRQESTGPCSEFLAALRTLATDCSLSNANKQQIATMLADSASWRHCR